MLKINFWQSSINGVPCTNYKELMVWKSFLLVFLRPIYLLTKSTSVWSMPMLIKYSKIGLILMSVWVTPHITWTFITPPLARIPLRKLINLTFVLMTRYMLLMFIMCHFQLGVVFLFEVKDRAFLQNP